MEKTLEDSDITIFIDLLLNGLKDSLGIELR